MSSIGIKEPNTTLENDGSRIKDTANASWLVSAPKAEPETICHCHNANSNMLCHPGIVEPGTL